MTRSIPLRRNARVLGWPLGSGVRRKAASLVLLGAAACQSAAETPSRPAPAPWKPIVPAAVPAASMRAASAVPETSLPATPPDASQRQGARAAPDRWPLREAPGVITDWCIEGVDALDEETCYALPKAPTTTLLVYLHGIVPPQKTSLQKTNFETAVANAARRGGVAALMPRGEQGLAGRGHERWWGWPTGGSAYERHAEQFVEKFEAQQRRLEKVAGVKFTRRYVAGSSAGAYFAAALALRGDIAADGFGAMSGGAGTRTPELPKLEPKPFYIGYGTQDSVGPSARALGGILRAAGWPVRIAAHPVGHGAKEIYIDEALEFFRDTAR